MIRNMALLFIFFISLSSLAATPAEFFKFEDSFTCKDRFPHHSFCKAVVFQKWTESEKHTLKKMLDEIYRPELIEFFKTIEKKGITKLHRVKYSSTWYPNTAQRRTEFSRSARSALIWVDPVTNVVGITDSFFSSKDFIDPYAKISRKTLNILHEMAHIYDLAFNHISSDIDNVAGWSWVRERNRFEIKDQDYDQVLSKFDHILTYMNDGDSSKTYSEDRRLGIELGFPTLYSMTNSHECFAELLSYYILDPNSKDYLSIQIQDKLDEIINTEL